jgi:hypothetical protein
LGIRNPDPYPNAKASGFAIFVRAEEFWKYYFNDLCSFYLGVPAVESELIGAPCNI